jgi:hypothetical protein
LHKSIGKEIPAAISFYEEFRTGNRSLASFFLERPPITGIIEPDVVAPDEQFSSARSTACGPREHDLPTVNLQRMDGTSMSTLTVAGSTALMQHYLRLGFYQ